MRVPIIMSVADLLRIIAPADPDSAEHMGNGLYRLTWVAPPDSELEFITLFNSEDIEIVKQVHEGRIHRVFIRLMGEIND